MTVSQKQEPVVAIVTGGSSGIGRATCERLLASGVTVVAFDLNSDEAASDSNRVEYVKVDVSDNESVELGCARVLEAYGRIDVLVNNAGITGGEKATKCHETSELDWDRVNAVNARGPFLCARAVLPTMMEQGSGQIITLASIAGLVAFPGRCAYTASKGAALMLTKSIAVDYASFGIRANAVCPGLVETPMTQWRLDIPELRQKIESLIPLRRPAQPGEIAEAVAALALGQFAYMNGSAWVIDGGWSSL